MTRIAIWMMALAIGCSAPPVSPPETTKRAPMRPSPSAPGSALRWERLSPDQSLKTAVRPSAYSAVLGARMFVAFTDPGTAAFLVATDSAGTPASIGPVPVAVTGLCATAHRLVLTGLRARDCKPVVLELEPTGKVMRELELPVAGALHRMPRPVCTTAGVRVVWEESGPAKASTLAWVQLDKVAFGTVRRHAWAERTVGFEPEPDQTGVALLRNSGLALRSALHRITDRGPDAGVALPAPAIATPVTTNDGTAVLLVPAPHTLQLAVVDPSQRLSLSPAATIATPSAISGALLVAAGRGVWAMAIASSGPDLSVETPDGDLMQRHDFALVAFDARSGAAGPLQTIGPPVAAAWLDERLILWTGRTGARVSTWRLVP